jgi:hypothetical protein
MGVSHGGPSVSLSDKYDRRAVVLIQLTDYSASIGTERAEGNKEELKKNHEERLAGRRERASRGGEDEHEDEEADGRSLPLEGGLIGVPGHRQPSEQHGRRKVTKRKGAF